MVKIRLSRFGRRNRPFYRIHVFDSRVRRDGRAIEQLGWYDPMSQDDSRHSTLNVERARYWLGVGAAPTATVHDLFKRHAVYEENEKLEQWAARVSGAAFGRGRKKPAETPASSADGAEGANEGGDEQASS